MNVLLSTPELDAQIKQILTTIRLSMNGVVTDSMQSHGLAYKRSYGVDIPRLRTIAAGINKQHDLAQRLWLREMRETMILATLLQPVESFTPIMAQQWLERCNTIELTEQAVMNLYQHLPYATTFCMECLEAKIDMHKIFGSLLALRINQRFTNNETEAVIQSIVNQAPHASSSVCKAMGNALARFCRINRTTADRLQEITEKTLTSCKNTKAEENASFLYQVVRQELIFLGYLTEDF